MLWVLTRIAPVYSLESPRRFDFNEYQQHMARTGIDFVPGYPSPCYMGVPATTAFWACS